MKELVTTKDLGVILDKKLTFVPHIDNTVRKSSKMLGFVIRNTKQFKTSKTKEKKTNTLEYYSLVCRPHLMFPTHCILNVYRNVFWGTLLMLAVC